MKWDTFWEQFSIKIDEQIKAKIHTETVMNFDEQMMWKLIVFSLFFERCVHEKNVFFGKGECTEII